MNQTSKVGVWTVLCFLSLYLCAPVSAFADVTTQDFIENLDIKGDLRVRYDYQDNNDGKDDPKDRLRARFRFGLTWKNTEENWKVAAGLATGDLDCATTNATYSNEEMFETGDIRLDYAYAEHTLDNMVFVAGQHKNKFHSSMALWDPDVRPAGFTAQFKTNPFFITAGYFQTRYIDSDIGEMHAIQAGIEMDNFLVATSFYHIYDHDTYDIFQEYVDEKNEDSEEEIQNNLDPDYAYQIADIYATGNFTIGDVKISPHAHVFYNFGAKGEKGQSMLQLDGGSDLDPEDENLGWLVGIKTRIDRFSLGVEYGEVGADAAVAAIKDSDWGSGLASTDIKGWKTSVGYKLTKHCEFQTTYYYTEPMEREDYKVKDVNRVQVDLKYKF